MNDHRLAENIINKFEKELDSFPLNVRLHWAERIFRITGDEKYEHQIINYFEKRERRIRRILEIVDDKKAQKTFGINLIKNSEIKKDSPRFKQRFPVYKKYPEFKYLQELAWYLNKMKEYSFTKLFIKNISFNNYLQKVRRLDYEKYLLKKDILLVDPVQTINTLFHIKNIGIIDITNKVIKYCEDILDKDKSEFNFPNKLYFYTHVIISESKYYQKYVTKKYQYIFNFFEQNIDKILNLKNNDIIAEIGVCYKLARINNESLQRIKDKIRKEIQLGDGILLRKGRRIKKLSQIEHRNVLAVILFYNFNKLHKAQKLNF